MGAIGAARRVAGERVRHCVRGLVVGQGDTGGAHNAAAWGGAGKASHGERKKGVAGTGISSGNAINSFIITIKRIESESTL